MEQCIEMEQLKWVNFQQLVLYLIIFFLLIKIKFQNSLESFEYEVFDSLISEPNAKSTFHYISFVVYCAKMFHVRFFKFLH